MNTLVIFYIIGTSLIQAAFAEPPFNALTIPPCQTVNSLLESCLGQAPQTDLQHLVSFYKTCLCSPAPDKYDAPASSCASIIFSLQGNKADGKGAEWCAQGGTGFPTIPSAAAGGGVSSPLTTSSGTTTPSTSTASPGSGVASSSPSSSSGVTSTSGSTNMTTSGSGSAATTGAGATPASTSSKGGAVLGVGGRGSILGSLLTKLISVLAAVALV